MTATQSMHEEEKDRLTVGEQAARVGAWETPEGCVMFGSWQAVAAFYGHAQSALSIGATAASGAVPDGWKLAPIEPTPQMISDGFEEIRMEENWPTMLDRVYRAMIAAAPLPPNPTAASGATQMPEQIKDHIIAQTVNELTKIAREFHGTQQLRERIAEVVVPPLKAAISEREKALEWVESVAVPEGWKVVPIEPNDAMQLVGGLAVRIDTTTVNKLFTATRVYREMLAAAPLRPAPNSEKPKDAFPPDWNE